MGDEALAAWVFIDPRYVEQVAEWMAEHGYPPMRNYDAEEQRHKFLSGEPLDLGGNHDSIVGSMCWCLLSCSGVCVRVGGYMHGLATGELGCTRFPPCK